MTLGAPDARSRAVLRLGLRAARFLHTAVVALMTVYWVDASAYSGAAALVLAQGARDLRLHEFPSDGPAGHRCCVWSDHHPLDRGIRLIP